jgi:transposase-like protein
MKAKTPSERFPGRLAPQARATTKPRLEKVGPSTKEQTPEERYAAAASALGITPQEAFARIAKTLGVGTTDKDRQSLLLEREGVAQEWARLRKQRDFIIEEQNKLTVAKAEFFLAKMQRPWYHRMFG